jgi:hypothetical protein
VSNLIQWAIALFIFGVAIYFIIKPLLVSKKKKESGCDGCG